MARPSTGWLNQRREGAPRACVKATCLLGAESRTMDLIMGSGQSPEPLSRSGPPITRRRPASMLSLAMRSAWRCCQTHWPNRVRAGRCWLDQGLVEARERRDVAPCDRERYCSVDASRPMQSHRCSRPGGHDLDPVGFERVQHEVERVWSARPRAPAVSWKTQRLSCMAGSNVKTTWRAATRRSSRRPDARQPNDAPS